MADVRPPLALLVHPGAQLYGSDRMALESVLGLLAAGWRVVVALPERGPLADQLVAAGAEVTTTPMAVLRKSSRSPRGVVVLLRDLARSALPGWRLLRASRPAVVVVSTTTLPLWPLLARSAGVPVVAHVHEAESHLSAPVRAALAAPLRWCTRVIANSAHTRTLLLASAPALEERTTVIWNGVPSDGPAALDGAAGRPESGGALQLLYVGRISERKGVVVLLDAFARVREAGVDAHLHLVGDAFAGDPSARAAAHALRDRTSEPPLAGSVTWHGFSDAVADHLASCDALVVPAVLPESFGNTAVEGVLAGRPVVASAVGALPEVLHGAAGARLVPPGDVTALTEALLELAGELPDRRAQARAGVVEAASRYGVDRYRAEVVALLDEVAGRAPASAGPGR